MNKENKQRQLKRLRGVYILVACNLVNVVNNLSWKNDVISMVFSILTILVVPLILYDAVKSMDDSSK